MQADKVQIAARWFTKTNGRTIRVLVLHVMVAPEKPETAEAVANMFALGRRRASAHKCFDDNSMVTCVRDMDVAWAAAGANHDGLHYELAGYPQQSAQEWKDPYSLAMIDRVAQQVAKDAREYGIPIRRLTVAQVKDGISMGITHHADVEAAFPSTGHWDVGPNFDWNFFLDLVKKYHNGTTPWEDDEMLAGFDKNQEDVARATIRELCDTHWGYNKMDVDDQNYLVGEWRKNGREKMMTLLLNHSKARKD